MGEILHNPEKRQQRFAVGIPMTGLIRAEWAFARFGQVIPCNWSQFDVVSWLSPYSPIDFLVADARNIIVHDMLQVGAEWLFFIDHDVVLPPDTTIKLNERMIRDAVPVMSGLYFTKSRPAEPLVYKEIGDGYFADWKMGDEVWVCGLPMGCTLIHTSILKVMYEESEEYVIPGKGAIRKVFETPTKVWFDPEKGGWLKRVGTEDLNFCKRIMEEGIFDKAGWPEYKDKEHPFLIDTSIFCKHIDMDGVMYPSAGEEAAYGKSDISQDAE